LASDHIDQQNRVPRRRWGIAALLGFGILVSYFDRVNLSVSKEALHDAFGMTPVVFGFLSSAYNWPYAALQLPCGLLLDRFGVRRVGIVSTIIWTIASFAAALSTGVKSLFGARILLGRRRATGFRKTSEASPRRCSIRWRSFLRPSEFPRSAWCWCISAGARILR
jgi:sugar phosphate permease